MQARQQTQTEMGLSSVTSMLYDMSNNTIEGNIILESIQSRFDKFVTSMEKSVFSVLNSDWINSYTVTKNKSLETLISIKDNLEDMFYWFIDESKTKKHIPESIQVELNETDKNKKTIPESIPKELDKKKKDDKTSLKELKEKFKEAKEQLKGSIDYKGLSELITTMVKNLNNKLYKKIDIFSQKLSKFLEFDEEKVEKFNEGIGKISEIIESLNKNLVPAGKAMMMFSTSFIVLGLAVINPLLPLGIFMLGKFLNVITTAMDKKTLSKDIFNFAKGIGILTLSMFAMSFVPFVGIFKMLGFIFMLGFALRSHKGNNVSKDMMQFGMGIGILTLAMFAMSEISVGTMFQMLFFITGLGLALRAFSGVTGPPPLFKFAMGLGILVLAMFAMNELPWEAMFKTIFFIAALGLTLKLFSGGITGGLPSFAFGLGIMVLAMFAMNELPWGAMFKTLTFIGGLGLVLKLFGPQSGKNFLMIGGGLIAISAGLWIFKKTGFTLDDALLLGGIIVGLVAIVAAIGIPQVAVFVNAGAITLAIIGGALILISLGLSLASSTNINVENIWNFIKSVGLVALGFAAIAIPAVPGAIGAVLFIPIAVSALVGGLILGLLSVIPFNSGNVWNFVKSVGLLTLGFAAIALPAVPGAIGAALFLPIAAAGLLGALALMAISNVKINTKSISDFSTGMGLLISSFNSIGLIAAGKAAIKAELMVPLIKVGYQAAGLFQRMQSINIEQAKTGLLSMVDTLSIVMEKLETWKNDNSDESIKNIALFVSSFKGLDNKNFKSITDTMDKFLNSLSDDKKWKSINSHMITLANNVKQIVTNVNMLNLEKAVALERNLKLLTNKDNNTNLKDVIEKLKEMIGLLYENQKRVIQTENTTKNTPTTVPGVDPKLSLIPTKVPDNLLFDKNDNNTEVPFTNFLDALENAIINVRIVNESGSNKIDWKNGK